MASVLLREVFAFEDVAQVPAAVGADYLCATAVGVRMALHASGIFFIETGPAAARLEFGRSRVKRVVATPADKRAGRKQRVVVAAERPFRSFVDDDALLFG